MEINFTVLGKPCGKGRPRFMRNGHTYTDAKTENYENLVKLSYQEKFQEMTFERDVPLEIEIKAYFPIPKGISKKKRPLYENETILFSKKPDWDNIGKIICDSLNNIAYYDDNQIAKAFVIKLYGKTPRVEITIRTLEE